MDTLAIEFGDSFLRNTIAGISYVGIGGAAVVALVFNWMGWGVRNGFSLLCTILCGWFVWVHFWRGGAKSGDAVFTTVTNQMQSDILWFIPVIALLAFLYRKKKAVGLVEAFLHGTLLTIMIVHLFIPLFSGVDMSAVPGVG